MTSLTTFTSLFYFASYPQYDNIIKKKFPQEFQCFHKICTCHSNFTVRNFDGVFHALLLRLLVNLGGKLISKILLLDVIFEAYLNTTISTLKLVSAIFYQIFISHQMIALQKLRKILFISPKKLFSFSRYSNFCIFIFPSFSPCQPLFRG